MAPIDPQSFNLTATYQSPTNAAFTRIQPLPAPTTSSAKDRVAYLSALRKATLEMQERINKELTERMDEDKAKEMTGKRKAAELDDAKEEENYGEEVVED